MSANREQIIEQLSAYLQKRFLAKDVVLETDMPFAEIGIDSMTVVELVMYLEEEFGIVIPANELTGDNLRSLQSLARCAYHHQA